MALVIAVDTSRRMHWDSMMKLGQVVEGELVGTVETGRDRGHFDIRVRVRSWVKEAVREKLRAAEADA